MSVLYRLLNKRDVASVPYFRQRDGEMLKIWT